MNPIAAVICNYNKSKYVTECIQSVLESSVRNFDIIVVDNASTDDSAACIRKKYEGKLVLLENSENLGGSGGFNTGIRYAVEKGYEYVWCLDNDVLVDENAIGVLYDFLEKNPNAGMAGSKVYHMEEPDYVQQFGIDVDFEDFCCEAKYCNCLEDGSMPEVVYSDAVAACSVLVRVSLIEKIGMLPEENFLYWDDTEWGYRCNLAGYKVASVGASKVLHSMGAKKEAVNTFPTYYAWRNWIRFFMKYTEEEKLETMCESFLEGIFEIIYDGFYKGDQNRAKTVMSAYDDAIHGVTGKAGENRIFVLDKNEEKLCALLKGLAWVEIGILEEGLDSTELEERILAIDPEIEIRKAKNGGKGEPSEKKVREKEAGRTEKAVGKSEEEIEEEKRTAAGNGRRFIICRDIFALEDYLPPDIFVDAEGRIMESEEDFFKVFNKGYSYRTFLFTQKPLFLEQVRAFRRQG
ncbi:MAG: glycosyltransferase family 2 protein [Lachnospiraceae bacterium]|nr:glycosyltransferase family 2 protein [Lachnospiraceae bacterium]